MRQLRWTIAVLLFSAGSSFAFAQGCGPTRLKVTESVTLDLSPAQAWAKVGSFQDMSWDADTTGVSGSGGNQPDKAIRVVTLQNGTTMEESLYKYDAETMSYAYHVDHNDVSKLPVQNASATLEVVPDDGGAKSVVRWRFVFYRNLAPGEGYPDVADANAVAAMKRFIRSGLDGLKTKVTPRS